MRRVLVFTIGFVGVLIATASAQDGVRREENVPPPAKPPPLTRPPTLIEAVAPEYPPQAALAGLEAKVKVRIRIDETGAVTRADVVTPVGNGFDEAAVAAARQYKFSPAEWGGVPGPIVVETTLNFVLETTEAPEPAEKPADGSGGDTANQVTGPPSHGGDYARPVAIEGVALERGVRRKLAGVIVSVAGIDAVTDENGKFYFHGIAPGEHELIAVDDDFDRFRRGLTLAPREKLTVRLYLRPRGGNPYETVVEAEREVLEVTRRTVQRRQMTTVPGTFGDSLRVIQSLPGLARTPFVTGFLLIRGSNPDDSGVFVDGHRIPILYHFLGGPSVLNAEFLESINLYPGGYPARFGRSSGGIVSVETRSSKSDGVHGSADVDVLDSSGYVRVPVGKGGSLAVAGRRSYLDIMLSQFVPEADPGTRLLVVPVYYDYQARYDQTIGQGKASVFVIGSGDRLDVVSSDPDAEEFFSLNTTINFFRVIGTYKRPISGGLTLTLSPAYGRDSFSISSGQFEDSDAFTSFSADEDTLSYRMRIDGRLSKHLVLDAGVDIESRVTRYAARLPIADDLPDDATDEVDVDPEDVARNFDNLLYGLHADLAIDIEKLRIIPGLRFDGHLLAGRNHLSVDPRMVVRYAVTPKWTAKAYGGVFHQPPQPEATDFQFGNPDIGLERAYHTGVGAEWAFAKNWKADAEAYYVGRTRLARSTDDLAMNDDGDFERINVLNSGSGDTFGVELLLKRELTRNLYGWLSYTLSTTRTRRDSDADYVPTTFDQRHTLNAVASYKTNNGWEFGGRWRLSTGRPDTEVIDATFDSDENGYDPVRGPFRAARRPTFSQLDVRGEKTWVYDTWMLGVYVDIMNVLNQENTEAVQFDYRFRERSPITGVPFVPTIGIRGQW